MEAIYCFAISFILIFLSELGDKTQILVLSFSSKLKSSTLLFGVALGSFFSHGIAILFGSTLGYLSSAKIHYYLEIVTYFSFILIGIFSLLQRKNHIQNIEKSSIINIAKLKLNYIFIIAISIAIGEIGDKTFLASVGLGIKYPFAKLFLILGAIFGMCMSNLIAIAFGKLLSKKIPSNFLEKSSSVLFLLFGVLGLIRFLLM